MFDNICNIRRTFQMREDRKWDTLYVMIDVHGTIIPSSWHRKNDLQFISEDCIEVLQWFSKRKDIKIILWTSSYPSEIAEVIEWLEKHSITIDYANCNPECKNTEFADFNHKPYFNMIIDDKCGFAPESGWREIKHVLMGIGEWTKYKLDS